MMKKYLLVSALMLCIAGLAQPAINSFAPTSAAVGSAITITGTNFSSVKAENIVYFGSVKAVVNTATNTTLTVTVPTGASYQPISVTVNGLTAYAKTPFNVIFNGANTSFTPASFTASNIELTKPAAVAFADIDGDGKPDMIITNKTDSTISVYRNTSTGGGVSFEPKIDFKIGTKPRFIIAGDVNGDGKQDIISININNANAEDASFTILINKSTLGQVLMTAQKKNISRGTFPGMSLGDFDLDGKPDVAVASMDSSQLVIYGNASTADSVKFSTEKKIALSFAPEYMINADLDGDGKTDLLMSRSGDSSLYVLRNTSTPGVFSFASPVNIGFAAMSQTYNPFVIADFNNDGKPDIAFPNPVSGKVAIFKNTSAGADLSFTGVWSFTVGNKPLTLAAGDLNGDGLPDLIVNNTVSATMSLLKNTSSGGSFSFETKADFPVSNTGNTTDAIAAIADLDMNGAYDFVGYNTTLNGFLVYQNRMLLSPAPGVLISSFTPTSGKQGDTIIIKGKTFATTSEVRFGGVTATYFKTVGDTLISAVVGNGKSGVVSVISTTGTDSLAGFTFIPAIPKIISLTPTSGKTGDTISIRGSRFTGATLVSFGNSSAASFIIVSDSLIKAVVGAGASGFVKITTPSGTDSLAGFTFLSGPPKINSFTPSSGTTGDTISIKGLRFSAATEVRFGIYPVAFTVISDSLVKAVLGSGGSGSVKLSTLAGTDSLAGFVFISSIPKINSFTPSSGTNGDTISIKGVKLTGTTSVYFGSVAAKAFSVISDSLIKAVVGLGGSGLVKIQNHAGFDSASGFIYTASAGIPKITSYSPLTGTTGTKVTIIGKNLNSVTSVSFGNTPVASFISNNDTSISATIGGGSSGFVKVSGTAGKDSLSGFIYTAPIQPVKVNSFTPSNGSIGTVVSIRGLKFTGATTVSFGGTSALAFTVVSDSAITATVGPGASGFVVVRTSNGSDSLTGFIFNTTTANAEINVDTTRNHFSFSAVKGGYSPSQSFIFSALRLITDVTVNCPYPFTVSKNPDSGFTSIITIPAVNSKIDSAKVYVRFKGDDTVILLSNALTLSAGGALSKNVFLAGSICDSSILQVPVVNAFTKDTTLCIRDSLVLSPAANYTKYKWSTGDSTKMITVKKSASISLQVVPKAGCFSASSAVLKIVKDSNAIPVLALTGDTTLISSSAPNYRWYFNNTLIAGSTSNKLTAKKIGFYGVETSNDKICWSQSNDYPIVMLPAILVNDSASVKAYPNPATGGVFNVVVTLQRPTNVIARVTVTDAAGVVLLQTNKFIFFGREIKIPITLNAAAKGTVFIKVDINGDVKTQTVILQ